MTTVAATIAGTLCEAGIRTVFGLPGGETVELLDEFRVRDVDFVLVRNESSAVFMADGFARVSGMPGVAMTTLGPGAANAVMGVAHCFLDRSPVLVITAQKPDNLLTGYTHQVLDLHALFRPITKASIKIHAGNARHAILSALSIACSGRPGPVHLQLSNEDAASLVSEAAVAEHELPKPVGTVGKAETGVIECARQYLVHASRPLIVAGLGLEPQRPYVALGALAKAAHAPVVVTPKAKGALPDSHPLAAGTIGLTKTDLVYQLVDEADCIVAVGFDVVELVKSWEFDGPLIWIAPWDNQDPRLPAQCELVGDIGFALTALVSDEYEPDEGWGEKRVARFRLEAPQISAVAAAAGRVSPQSALRVMRDCAAPDTILAVDVGSHKIFSSLHWPSFEPNRFLLSNGLSSMGFALPAAIGAASASAEAPVLCLTGDAGLSMNMGELGVLAETELPVVVVVFNDGAIDLIRSHQQRAGKPVFGTEFRPAHYDQIGAAYGLTAHRVHSAGEFETALSASLSAGAPALIEVMLDPSGYPTTPQNSPTQSGKDAR